MSVYKHQQGNYRSYRVARSVDGKLCQEYFPRTRKGYQEAKKRDEELAKDQERAQQFFTGPALRWQKKDTKSQRAGSSRRSSGSAARVRVQPRLVRSKSGSTTRTAKTAAQAKTTTRRTTKTTTTIKTTPKRASRTKQTSRAKGSTRG